MLSHRKPFVCCWLHLDSQCFGYHYRSWGSDIHPFNKTFRGPYKIELTVKVIIFILEISEPYTQTVLQENKFYLYFYLYLS